MGLCYTLNQNKKDAVLSYFSRSFFGFWGTELFKHKGISKNLSFDRLHPCPEEKGSRSF